MEESDLLLNKRREMKVGLWLLSMIETVRSSRVFDEYPNPKRCPQEGEQQYEHIINTPSSMRRMWEGFGLLYIVLISSGGEAL